MIPNLFEPVTRPLAGWRKFQSDIGAAYAANGLVGFIFAATGPVAVILSVGVAGGLSEAQLASWIFGAFFLNGLLSIAFCLLYQRPLVFFWTIPGTVLVGPALTHLSFAEVTGAFIVTGLLMLLLGLLGWVRRLMQAIPMAIVMGMVAGVFLRFGLELVRAVFADTIIVGPMVAIWLVLSAIPRLGRRLPPIIGALLVGASMTILFGRFDPTATLQFELIRPVMQVPVWSIAAMVELVVPLAITVLVVQNGQGFAVLKAGEHAPPINAVTLACGIGSVITAIVGGVSTCLTGPTNAIVISSGEQKRQYTAAMFVGCLALVFGLLAPTFTRLLLVSPKSLVMALAGLAMLRVLQTAFVTAFKERFSFGALVAFLVSVADVPLLNIGAAFWGLVSGVAISLLLERSDFAAETKS